MIKSSVEAWSPTSCIWVAVEIKSFYLYPLLQKCSNPVRKLDLQIHELELQDNGRNLIHFTYTLSYKNAQIQ